MKKNGRTFRKLRNFRKMKQNFRKMKENERNFIIITDSDKILKWFSEFEMRNDYKPIKLKFSKCIG